ncbi:unnamed protein product [Coregonus sp. 'balchen']|nr:unnamed protein product [Coregonus sp. 'balchen']
MNRPAPPVEVCYKNMRFLITHNPTNATLSTFIEDLKQYGATTVVRVCEVTYDKTPLEKDGITVMPKHSPTMSSGSFATLMNSQSQGKANLLRSSQVVRAVLAAGSGNVPLASFSPRAVKPLQAFTGRTPPPHPHPLTSPSPPPHLPTKPLLACEPPALLCPKGFGRELLPCANANQLFLSETDWAFDDGAPPPTKIVDDWLNLLKSKFSEGAPPAPCSPQPLPSPGKLNEPPSLPSSPPLPGAPVLVALALIEGGMKYEEAVQFIRQYVYLTSRFSSSGSMYTSPPGSVHQAVCTPHLQVQFIRQHVHLTSRFSSSGSMYTSPPGSVQFIRQHVHLTSSKQLTYLEKYRSRQRLRFKDPHKHKNKCCVM